jgi:hypothetical protein
MHLQLIIRNYDMILRNVTCALHNSVTSSVLKQHAVQTYGSMEVNHVTFQTWAIDVSCQLHALVASSTEPLARKPGRPRRWPGLGTNETNLCLLRESNHCHLDHSLSLY